MEVEGRGVEGRSCLFCLFVYESFLSGTREQPLHHVTTTLYIARTRANNPGTGMFLRRASRTVVFSNAVPDWVRTGFFIRYV